MNIAVLSFYYPPDIGAAANRISGFVKKWNEKGHEVIVITTVPHYPSGKLRQPYTKNRLYVERNNGLLVYRVPTFLAGAEDSIFKRLVGQIIFTFKTIRLIPLIRKKLDIIIVTSPPLVMGFAGLIMSYKLKTPLVTEIRDLWPESLIEMKKIYKFHPIVIVASLFARYLYKKSKALIGVTKGITRRLRSLKENVSWIPNGIDPEMEINFGVDISMDNRVFKIIYTGLIGYMQELEKVVEAFKLLRNRDDIQLLIVGSGSKKQVIKDLIDKFGLEKQVKLLGEKSRSEVIRLIQSSHVGLVTLKNIKLFRDAFPSKVFDYILCKKPILSTVGGELEEFIREYGIGIVIDSQNVREIIKAVNEIQRNYNFYKKNLDENYNSIVESRNLQSLADKYIEFMGDII